MSNLTFDDALRIAQGCTDYGGGYRGSPDLFEAYQQGIRVVIRALQAAKDTGLADTQIRALSELGKLSANNAANQKRRGINNMFDEKSQADLLSLYRHYAAMPEILTALRRIAKYPYEEKGAESGMREIASKALCLIQHSPDVDQRFAAVFQKILAVQPNMVNTTQIMRYWAKHWLEQHGTW